ncbi:hypothetical protein ANN_05270 [Periplaneta americana]|uniref:Uncharacterized protein n=1 Tax=Periplaneta americana TaxID=6978 RepID=A0ABQ8TCC7_PERAM|nr:hypothetical protein ANN_05270 [Periplaneta americana]
MCSKVWGNAAAPRREQDTMICPSPEKNTSQGRQQLYTVMSAEDAPFSIKRFLGNWYPPFDILAAADVTAYSTSQVFEAVHFEAWTLRKKDESRITDNEMKFMRYTAGYTKWDHKRNEEVMEELQLEPVINHVKHYQNWINHLHRMHRDRIPKVMLHYRPNGKRSLGRPKKRWIENSTISDCQVTGCQNLSHVTSQQTHLSLLDYFLSPDVSLSLSSSLKQVTDRAVTCGFLRVGLVNEDSQDIHLVRQQELKSKCLLLATTAVRTVVSNAASCCTEASEPPLAGTSVNISFVSVIRRPVNASSGRAT